MNFDRMEGGWYMAAVTPKADEFAGDGDDCEDRLVAVSFAKFLSERGVEFDWSADDPTNMVVGGYWPIRMKATRETGAEMKLTGDGTTWTLYGNTVLGNTVVLMGLSYRNETVPTRFLLSIDEFVRGVTPNAELAA